MLSKIPPNHPLRRMFHGLVEQVFMTDIGICDASLTDYLSDMLAGFVHIDDIYRLRTIDGRIIREVSQMQVDADFGRALTDAERNRLINQYIGDFTLFWTGLYPETLRPRRSSGANRLREYLLQGKRSYGIASELTPAGKEPPPELLANLSAQFECCVHGLQLVRTSWQQLAQQPPAEN